jgi:hypothetical protein
LENDAGEELKWNRIVAGVEVGEPGTLEAQSALVDIKLSAAEP